MDSEDEKLLKEVLEEKEEPFLDEEEIKVEKEEEFKKITEMMKEDSVDSQKFHLLDNDRIECDICHKNYASTTTIKKHFKNIHQIDISETKLKNIYNKDFKQAVENEKKKTEMSNMKKDSTIRLTYDLFYNSNKMIEKSNEMFQGLSEKINDKEKIYKQLLKDIIEEDEEIQNFVEEHLGSKVNFVITYAIDLFDVVKNKLSFKRGKKEKTKE